ncbi:MAG: hypothetical protein WD003_01400 [Candidatus Paceibacterota bacterium]
MWYNTRGLKFKNQTFGGKVDIQVINTIVGLLLIVGALWLFLKVRRAMKKPKKRPLWRVPHINTHILSPVRGTVLEIGLAKDGVRKILILPDGEKSWRLYNINIYGDLVSD